MVTDRPVGSMAPIDVSSVPVCVPRPVNSTTTVSPSATILSIVIWPSGNPLAQFEL